MSIRKSRCNVGFVGRTICIIKIALEHNLLEQDIFSINYHKQGIFWHLRFHIFQVFVATCIIPFPSTFGIESGNALGMSLGRGLAQPGLARALHETIFKVGLSRARPIYFGPI